MTSAMSHGRGLYIAAAFLAGLSVADTAFAEEKAGGAAPAPTPPAPAATATTPAPSPDESADSSVEQGKTPIDESFEPDAQKGQQKTSVQALKETTFKVNLRTYYFDREKFDGSESEAWAIGGWAGLKTGYFLERVSFGATFYASERLYGPIDKDGTLLLQPGQKGYEVLGEAYGDIKLADKMNLYVGRKEFDTPYINRNDVRMTPNTFSAIALQGSVPMGKDGDTLRYGAGYFDKIKERNSEEFVSMAKDAGASVNRGVFTAGANYLMKNGFSIGAIDYYCADIINIGYVEAKYKLPLDMAAPPTVAFQFTDQRSVGDNLLQGTSFSGRQFGLKVDLPVKRALFTAGYTQTTNGTNMQNPWSSYPGYTSVQVQDFNRAGEGAFLLRAAYDFAEVQGLSAYALAVLGTTPDAAGQFKQNEYDLNVQWGAPKESMLQGLALRLRYAIVHQDGGGVDDLKDFRVICNYAFNL